MRTYYLVVLRVGPTGHEVYLRTDGNNPELPNRDINQPGAVCGFGGERRFLFASETARADYTWERGSVEPVLGVFSPVRDLPAGTTQISREIIETAIAVLHL